MPTGVVPASAGDAATATSATVATTIRIFMRLASLKLVNLSDNFRANGHG
ncbi:MAG: hypothetical protein ABI317_16450 [Gaiellales bacterium]